MARRFARARLVPLFKVDNALAFDLPHEHATELAPSASSGVHAQEHLRHFDRCLEPGGQVDVQRECRDPVAEHERR